LAQAWLAANGKQAWSEEIAGMINEHHKITAIAGSPVEAFRRADWTDVTWGVINHGIPRALRREVFAAFPDAGFHAMLPKLSSAPADAPTQPTADDAMVIYATMPIQPWRTFA
jgi:hypothetical protein